MSVAATMQRCGPLRSAFRLPLRLGRRASHWLSTALWRLSLKRCGPRTVIQWGARIECPRQTSIGADCLIWHDVRLSSEAADGELELGDRVHLNAGCVLDHTGGLVIGDDTLVSEGAIVWTHGHGHDAKGPPQPRRKTIGAGVWIGARALVLDGAASIGDGAVIGAGAVVSRRVNPDSVVAGNPAKAIGKRSSW